MDCSRFVDYSDRSQSLVELYNYPCITPDNFRDATRAIVSDRFSPIELGDSIEVNLIDNRIENIQGVLTIWRNKAVACLDLGEGGIWGEWVEDVQVLLTYEFQEIWEISGVPRIGRIAYNAHGIRGKFEKGRFYTLFRAITGRN